jgi:hypothetical protein
VDTATGVDDANPRHEATHDGLVVDELAEDGEVAGGVRRQPDAYAN